MGAQLTRLLWLCGGAMALCVGALGGCSACSSSDSSQPSADAAIADHATTETSFDAATDPVEDQVLDATAGDTTDAIVVGPWDPVWHTTTPAQWPPVPVGSRPDCGAHCKVIASSLPEGIPDRAPRANDRWVVMQGHPTGKMGDPPRAVAVNLDMSNGPKEWIIDDASWIPGGYGVGQIAVDEDLILYVAGGLTDLYVVLAHLVTAERKIVWKVPMESAEAGFSPGTLGSALALPYAYWMATPGEIFYRFDTRNGELKSSVQTGSCEFISGTATGLGACASAGSGLTVIDFDQGSAYMITKTGFQQANGMLSQDGKDAIWIDFRDPGSKGEHGSYDSPWGGEVYHKLITDSGDERLTFDTPTSPTMKTSPWAQNGNLAWVTLSGTANPNPTGTSYYWYSGGKVVVRPKGGVVTTLVHDENFGQPRPVAPGVVATWYDSGTKRAWVVLLDWP